MTFFLFVVFELISLYSTYNKTKMKYITIYTYLFVVFLNQYYRWSEILYY